MRRVGEFQWRRSYVRSAVMLALWVGCAEPEPGVASDVNALAEHLTGVRIGMAIGEAQSRLGDLVAIEDAASYIAPPPSSTDGFTELALGAPVVPRADGRLSTERIFEIALSGQPSLVDTANVVRTVTQWMHAEPVRYCRSLSGDTWQNELRVWSRGDSGGVLLEVPSVRAYSAMNLPRVVSLRFYSRAWEDAAAHASGRVTPGSCDA